MLCSNKLKSSPAYCLRLVLCRKGASCSFFAILRMRRTLDHCDPLSASARSGPRTYCRARRTFRAGRGCRDRRSGAAIGHVYSYAQRTVRGTMKAAVSSSKAAFAKAFGFAKAALVQAPQATRRTNSYLASNVVGSPSAGEANVPRLPLATACS